MTEMEWTGLRRLVVMRRRRRGFPGPRRSISPTRSSLLFIWVALVVATFGSDGHRRDCGGCVGGVLAYVFPATARRPTRTAAEIDHSRRVPSPSSTSRMSSSKKNDDDGDNKSNGNFFDDIKNFFDELSGNVGKGVGGGGGGGGNAENEKQNEKKEGDGASSFSRSEYRDDNDDEDDDDDDDVPAGTYRIATIPVKSIKPGGLRLFVMLYLMGMQNTPDAGSWVASQPTTDEYVVDFWYRDESAILSVTLSDDAVTIDRVGSAPTNAYIMQESVIIEGILDELQTCASDESVPEENRLLTLHEPKDAIQKARSELAFG